MEIGADGRQRVRELSDSGLEHRDLDDRLIAFARFGRDAVAQLLDFPLDAQNAAAFVFSAAGHQRAPANDLTRKRRNGRRILRGSRQRLIQIVGDPCLTDGACNRGAMRSGNGDDIADGHDVASRRWRIQKDPPYLRCVSHGIEHQKAAAAGIFLADQLDALADVLAT